MVRGELMGLIYNSPRVHLRREQIGLCETDGACGGRGSELISLEGFFNPQEFIYVVSCYGFVKRVGLVGGEGPSCSSGSGFLIPRSLRCELLGLCGKDGACRARGSELNSWE